jgi:peptidoglycan lytic transglycosylase
MSVRKRRWIIVGTIGIELIVLALVVVIRLRSVPHDAVRLVRSIAVEQGIDPDLAEALLRVESRGDPQARSPVGALGLMQLMPATAREVAASEGIELDSDEDILDPRTNARLGLVYLKSMLSLFDDDEWLAVAAYNAGPGRVTTWRNENPGLDSRALLHEVAYAETRAHVTKVMDTRDGLRRRARR